MIYKIYIIYNEYIISKDERSSRFLRISAIVLFHWLTFTKCQYYMYNISQNIKPNLFIKKFGMGNNSVTTRTVNMWLLPFSRDSDSGNPIERNQRFRRNSLLAPRFWLDFRFFFLLLSEITFIPESDVRISNVFRIYV